MTSPRRAGPPQLDQKIKLRSAPTAPTISRIQPTVTRSTPDTVASTAQTRIAPAAIRSRLIPIPMSISFRSSVVRFVPNFRGNRPRLGRRFRQDFCSKTIEFRYVGRVTVTHDERLARNETVFREINERIHGAVAGHPADGHVYEYLCECSDASCVERVRLLTDEYEAIRSDPRRFVLAPGHAIASIEVVVDARPEHLVVEKVGSAGEVAEALDPRAA